jgi:hypothetical protein
MTIDGLELVISSYRIPGTGLLSPVHLERCERPEGDARWAIRHAGCCLNRKAEWEFEPIPSSRTDAFFARCRYDTIEEALAVWKLTDRKGRFDVIA